LEGEDRGSKEGDGFLILGSACMQSISGSGTSDVDQQPHKKQNQGGGKGGTVLEGVNLEDSERVVVVDPLEWEAGSKEGGPAEKREAEISQEVQKGLSKASLGFSFSECIS